MKYLDDKTIGFLKEQVNQEFSKIYIPNLLNSKRKADHSLITDLDISISNLIKNYFLKFPELSFFSEEENSGLKFPCIILDPIDGTRDLIKGYRECSVSLAIVQNSNLDGEAWIYNPITGFSISTNDKCLAEKTTVSIPYLGLTSRSEYEKGLYNEIVTNKFQIMPKGSIAFKLGLLAAGACDFVFTSNGKNLWDIAAGTILCKERDIVCFEQNKRLVRFDEESYQGPFLWGKLEIIKEVHEHLR
jgi:myo-inositol-1(or 4)-monophosphatase